MNAPEMVASSVPQRMDYHEVARILPYAFPWLLIDRVVSWNRDEIVVTKAVSGGEQNMTAHLRDGPSIMPGVLLVEFVNQAAMLLAILRISAPGSAPTPPKGAGVLARVKGTFYSSAYIGDLITATVRITVSAGNKTAFEGLIHCGERQIAKVESIGALVQHETQQAIAA